MNENYIEYVDSDFRVSGNSSNFTYNIHLTRPFNRCAVVSASIPKTWYMVQSGYNTFTVTENSGTRTITIPIGDYTISSFRTVLIDLLNTGTTYVYSIDITTYASTNKIIYNVSNNSGFQPSFTFPNTSVLYRLMGFEYNSTNVFSSSSITSPNMPFFQHTNVIFIRSNLQSPENSSLSGDILQQITSIGNPQLSAISYNAVDISKQSKPFNNNNNSIFKFCITDADGFVLDLNGIPINIEIVFYNVDNSASILSGKALLDNWEKIRDRYKT